MMHQNDSLKNTLQPRKAQMLEIIPENQDEDFSLGSSQFDNGGIASTSPPEDKPSDKSTTKTTAELPTFKDHVRTLRQQQIPYAPSVLPMASSTSNVNPTVTTNQAEVIPQHRRSELLQHMIDAKNTIGSDLERGTIDADSNSGSISNSSNNSATAERVVEEPNRARKKQNFWMLVLLVTIVVLGAGFALMVVNDDENKFSPSSVKGEKVDADDSVYDQTEGANLFWKGQSAFLSATSVHLTVEDGTKWEYSFVDDYGRQEIILAAGKQGNEISREKKWEEAGKERRLRFVFSSPQNQVGNRLIESQAYDQNERWVHSIMPRSDIWMPPDSLFHCDFVEFNYRQECSESSVCSSAKLVAEDFYVGAYLASDSYSECALDVYHPCKNNGDGNTFCRVIDGVQTCEKPDSDRPKDGADSRNCFRTFG